MDGKKFCSINLGKRVSFTSDGKLVSGMVVGYPDTGASVLVSFTTDEGWHLDPKHYGYQILVSSPLNVTFWDVPVEKIIFEEILSPKDSLYDYLFTKITDGISDWDVTDLRKLLSLAEKRGADKVLAKMKDVLEDF